MGVKFGTEEGTFGPVHRAKFHPHRCNDKGVGPQKLKFLLRFDRNLEYKRRAYPLRDFHKICRVCTLFQDALAVKILLDFLKGLWTYGGFKLTGPDYPQIFSAPSSETMHQTPKIFRGARMCSRSSITMPSLVGLGFHPPPGRPKTFIFRSSSRLELRCVRPSVCLSQAGIVSKRQHIESRKQRRTVAQGI